MSAFLNWLTTEFLSALLLWIIPALLIEQSRVCFGVWWWRLFTLLSTLQTLLWLFRPEDTIYPAFMKGADGFDIMILFVWCVLRYPCFSQRTTCSVCGKRMGYSLLWRNSCRHCGASLPGRK